LGVNFLLVSWTPCHSFLSSISVLTCVFIHSFLSILACFWVYAHKDLIFSNI
jgi:hypothetical protein